jgi:hypothetical protein
MTNERHNGLNAENQATCNNPGHDDALMSQSRIQETPWGYSTLRRSDKVFARKAAWSLEAQQHAKATGGCRKRKATTAVRIQEFQEPSGVKWCGSLKIHGSCRTILSIGSIESISN